jgi:hypothetical protein
MRLRAIGGGYCRRVLVAVASRWGPPSLGFSDDSARADDAKSAAEDPRIRVALVTVMRHGLGHPKGNSEVVLLATFVNSRRRTHNLHTFFLGGAIFDP